MKMKRGLGFALGVGALFGVASVAVPVYAEEICADSTIETTCTAGTIDELIAGISNANVEGINLSNTINIAASAALDITNKTIVSGSYDAFVVTGEDVVFDISGDGEIRSGRYVVDVENGSTVNLAGGTLRTTGTGGFYGVYLFGGATLNMTGGVIDTTSGSGAAVGGNNTTGDMNFVMSGGTLKSKYQTVFMPSQVDLKISGGTLEGGIYAKMGQIDISGGEINGIADANSLDRLEDYYGLGDGYAWLGDAIAVQGGQYASANETYGNSLNIKISGGKISATNGSALLVWNAGKLEQSMKVEITGGEFSSAEGVESVRIIEDISTVVTPKAGFGVVDNAIDTTISGGVFSAEPEQEYIVDGRYAYETDAGYVVDGWASPIWIEEIDVIAEPEGVASEATVAFVREAFKNLVYNGQIENQYVALVWDSDIREDVLNGKKFKLGFSRLEGELDELLDGDDITRRLRENEVVISAYDIDYRVYDEDGTELGAVYEIDEAVTLEFEIPEDLPEVAEGYERTFYLWRSHRPVDGRMNVGVLDDAKVEGNKISVENKLFSTFAVTYIDTLVEEQTSDTEVVAPETGRFTKEAEDFAKPNSKVGVWVLACGMMMLGYGLVSLGKQYQEALRKR